MPELTITDLISKGNSHSPSKGKGVELGCPWNKQKKIRFEPKQTETRSVSVVCWFVSWNKKQKNSVCFGVSNLYRNNWTKQNCFETTLKLLKNTKICSLSNCFSWSSVCFGSIETLKLSVSVKNRNNQNRLFRNKPKQTETNQNNHSLIDAWPRPDLLKTSL